jgi:hypothetical protein
MSATNPIDLTNDEYASIVPRTDRIVATGGIHYGQTREHPIEIEDMEEEQRPNVRLPTPEVIRLDQSPRGVDELSETTDVEMETDREIESDEDFNEWYTREEINFRQSQELFTYEELLRDARLLGSLYRTR